MWDKTASVRALTVFAPLGTFLEPEPIAEYRHRLTGREGRSIIKALSCQYDIRRGGSLIVFLYKRDFFNTDCGLGYILFAY